MVFDVRRGRFVEEKKAGCDEGERDGARTIVMTERQGNQVKDEGESVTE